MEASTATQRRTRIVCISDTHNQTPKLPRGDVLIHAGDLTNQGSFSELQKTVAWLEGTDFERKIVIAGNHDVTLDRPWFEQHGRYFRYERAQDSATCIKLLKDSPSITYLEHESATVQLTRPDGPRTTFKVFGSPYSPEHGFWAFGYKADRAPSLWSAIPWDADMVITHTPPRDHCDTKAPHSPAGGGCEELRRALWRVRPKLAICGHMHAGRGVERVRWRLDGGYLGLRYMERAVEAWTDPGAGMGNKKESRVDLSSRGGKPLCNAEENPVMPGATQCPAANRISFTIEADSGRGEAQTVVRSRGREAAAAVRDIGVATAVAGGLPSSCSYSSSGVDGEREQQQQQWSDALSGRMGRRETCIINASFAATSYGTHKRFNKPIVVDLDLPVWDVGDEEGV